MSNISGELYLINFERIEQAQGVCYLDQQVTYDSIVYTSSYPFEFTIVDGQIQSSLIPNLLADPDDSSYLVYLRVGNRIVQMKLIVPDSGDHSIQQVLDTRFDTEDILYENDPRMLALLTDLNQDDIPDVLQQLYFQQLDVPVENRDGENTFFSTAASYESGTLELFLNGLKVDKTDFIELGSQQYEIFDPPEEEDELVAQYKVSV